MTCRFTFCVPLGLKIALLKKKKQVVAWVWLDFVCANCQQLQSLTPLLRMLAPAEEAIWGWGKQQGKELARGTLPG